jgi:Lrp/AsnC family transcriptional regulator, leucine-responsive regulatory protein
MIDAVDRRILDLLQENARIANAEIARRIDLAPSAVLERIRKLEEKGYILGYATIIDRKKLGLRLTAFVHVRAQEGSYATDIGIELGKVPEVLEVHHIAGEDCYLVKVVAADTEALARVLREHLKKLSEKVHTKTTIVMETIKEAPHIPLEHPSGDDD